MYEFNRVISDNKDLTKRRRIVVVEFVNGEELLSKEMQFKVDESDDQVKRAFKQYKDEINTPDSSISDIDYTEPEPDPGPTAEEVAFTEWNADLQRLVAALAATSLGLEVAPADKVEALRTKVQNGIVKTDERYINALAGLKSFI